MDDVYLAFCDQLQQAQLGQIALLDEDDGLLMRWAQICDVMQVPRLQQVESQQEASGTEQVDSWMLERNSWQLVQALYAERLAETPASSSDAPSTSANPYTPPLSVAQHRIEHDKQLVELSAIRDWLHSIPTTLNPAEIRRGYLPSTKNKIKQAKRSGQPLPRGIVQHLDPDAVLREAKNAQGGAGGRLESDDAAYEKALLRSLFEYVRAGQLDLAIDMCRQSDQSWRAASLSGGKLASDRALASGDSGFGEEEDAMDDELLQGGSKISGNVNRKLWKMMCRKLASSPNLDPYERALYGAISGDTASVLPVCSSWEDIVWAHVNSLFEAHVESGLWHSSSGRYWSHGSVQPIDDSTNRGGKSTIDPEDVLVAPAARGIRSELESIFDRLLKLERGDIAQASKNPYRVSQTYLIVGKIGDLLTTFVERLELAAQDTEPEALAHLLRFFTHLILVLRLLKQALPTHAANRILEAYISVLEANDQSESLIAFYASQLDSTSAIESYAHFLLTFGPDSDRQSRKLALLKASEHGLDLAAIACRTVELVLQDVRDDILPELNEDRRLGSSEAFDAYARIDARQLELIRSLEWLTFDRRTYSEALTQANALTRYFLSTDLPHAARELIFQLPADLLPVEAAQVVEKEGEDHDSQIREFLDYTSLFACLEKHTRWAEVWSRKPRTNVPKLEQNAFRDGISALIDDFYDSTVLLLNSDWLKLDLPLNDGDLDTPRRLAELARIRQLVIPHLVLRLHFTLYDSREILPSSLQRCFELANLVADERTQLYLEFVGERTNLIGDYLDQVRLASLAALEVGKDRRKYKRQFMNILGTIYRYLQLKKLSPEERKHVVPCLSVFAGKAAPVYYIAKLVIRLINAVSKKICADKEVSDILTVAFLPDYSVSLVEVIIPANGISEHISTAGTEASGTSNMKFVLNGGLLLGTADGTNIEICKEVDEENVFFFGRLTPEREPLYPEELLEAINAIRSGMFGDAGVFEPLISTLFEGKDFYLVSDDFTSYLTAQRMVDESYADRPAWVKKAILATSRMGKFSSDRAVLQHADEIWNVEPVKVESV